MTKYKVSFSGGTTVEAPAQATLKEVMNNAGINFDFPCGGRGRCGKCKIRIVAGANEPQAEDKRALTEEELAAGVRLACVTRVTNDLEVEFLSDKNISHRILLSSLNRTAKVEPHIIKRYVEVDKASIYDLRTTGSASKIILPRKEISMRPQKLVLLYCADSDVLQK